MAPRLLVIVALALAGCTLPGPDSCRTPPDPQDAARSSPAREATALLGDLRKADYAAAWARMAPAYTTGRSQAGFEAAVKALPGLSDHGGVRWTRVHYAPLEGNDAAERCLHALVQNVDVDGVLSTPRGPEPIHLHAFSQLGGRWGWNGLTVAGRRLDVHIPLQAPPQ
jgi:hypothetical protein